MKKSEALVVFDSRIVNDQVDCECLDFVSEIECEIRKASKLDKGFENVVFELGCTVLAKAYRKRKNKSPF